MADEQTPELKIALPVTWPGLEDLPLIYANQFVVSHGAGEIFVYIGSITPPLILGTPEEQFNQLQAITEVPAKPVARLALSLDRLRELVNLLQDHLKLIEQATSSQGEDE